MHARAGMLSRLYTGWSTLADKGFLMHADFADFLHEVCVRACARVCVCVCGGGGVGEK